MNLVETLGRFGIHPNLGMTTAGGVGPLNAAMMPNTRQVAQKVVDGVHSALTHIIKPEDRPIIEREPLNHWILTIRRGLVKAKKSWQMRAARLTLNVTPV